MKAVVQRVSRATVTIDGEVSGAIDRGLLVYLGVGKGDGERERDWMIDKITGLRIFSNEEGKFDKSVLDVAGGKLLVVSQFTLYGDVKKGRRPSFDGAMPPGDAEKLYDAFVTRARAVIGVETGRFGAHMLVESINDGPVTILLDTTAIADKTAP
jgi:D-tyrosyl-tRNA(Tyr) deacylase